MSLKSVDTYLKEEIESKLKIILSNRYIIEEILNGIQPDVVEDFISTYAGKEGRDVPVLYTMPQEYSDLRGAIYIGLKTGEANIPSIGNIEDTYSFKETGTKKVMVPVENYSPTRLCLRLGETAGEYYTQNISFASWDKAKLENDIITFNKKHNEALVGQEVEVVYTGKDSSAEKQSGTKKGFTTNEEYSVLALSMNMDIVRCLDQIIKAIFIMMRDNKQEQTSYVLQNLRFGQVDSLEVSNVDGAPNPETPQIIYGRETMVSYTVTHSLDIPYTSWVDNINLNLVGLEVGDNE